MGILLKSQDSYFIYEEKELGILVAIEKEDQKLIKKYWKSKDKSEITTKIGGFPLIQTEEQESLKIDFTKKIEYEISHLDKFD